MGWFWQLLAALTHAVLVSMLAFVMAMPVIILVAVASHDARDVMRYTWYGGYGIAALAGLVALVLGPPSTRPRRTPARYWNVCQACGETFRVAESVCPFCGHPVEPTQPDAAEDHSRG